MVSIVDSAVHVGNTQASIGTVARPSHQTLVVKQRLRLADRAPQLYREQQEDHGSLVVPGRLGTLGTVRTLQPNVRTWELRQILRCCAAHYIITLHFVICTFLLFWD